MDIQAAHHVMDVHLDLLDALTGATPDSASSQLAVALASVAELNRALEAPIPKSYTVTGPVGDIVEKLEQWIERLVDKLTEIMRELGPQAMFALQVGSTVSVTVTVGPFKQTVQ
jgi:hypothetical protein